MRIWLIFIVFLKLILRNNSDNCYINYKYENDNEKTERTMLSSGNVTALILARKGSKGIVNKNLMKINGISLIGRTINEIKDSGLFQEIWVSTDGEKIANEVKKYDALVHKRPDELATDTASSILAVQNFISSHSHVQNVALFQCTSPFLRKKYIKNGMKLFRKKDCVFTVTRDFKLRWIFDEETKLLKPLNFNLKSRPRRQDWSGEFVETGMFYMATRHLIESGVFQNEKCGTITIDPEDSLEIDTEHDLKLARCLLMENTSIYDCVIKF